MAVRIDECWGRWPNPTGLLEPLDWDTRHFGLPIARIVEPNLSLETLHSLLAAAREQGFALVYWFTDSEAQISGTVVQEFSGLLVDQRRTYAADLVTAPNLAAHRVSRIRKIQFVNASASEQLATLGVVAGEHSRFHVDPRIPSQKADELFRMWMHRSTKGEMADAVFVAFSEVSESEILGTVTVREDNRVGHIGLIAVNRAAQGKGIGRALVAAAHEWMIGRGAQRAHVVTQTRNRAACRLYESCGYTATRVENVFHFWP